MTAEICDIRGDCPGRDVAVIVFALLVFLLALSMFAAYAFELPFLKRIEIFLVLGILASNIVETGVASSPRTRGFGTFISELSWWSLLLALAAFILALSSGDRPKFEISAKQHDSETPPQPSAATYTATTTSPQPVQQPYAPQTPQPPASNSSSPPPAIP